MYSESDVLQASAETRRWVVICSIILALSIAIFGTGLALRSRLLSIGGSMLLAFVCYFLFETCLRPRWRYGQKMQEIKTGLTRETRCKFISFSGEPREINGMSCYDLLCKVGDQSEDERLFQFDAHRELPAFQPDDELIVYSQGNFVTNINKG